VHYNSIAPNYLHTLGIGLLRGREFTDTDRKGTPNVVIVNETLAHEMWPKTDAVGQVMVIGGTECTVVGVAQDAQYSSSADGAHPFFYRPYWQIQNNGDSRFIVRTASAPGAMLHDIKRVIRDIDANVPVGEDATMTQALSNDFGSLRLTRAVLVFAGTAALVLSAVGLYSVLAFVVARRTREIGIRMALGATRQQVVELFLRQGMKLVVGGAMVGVVIAVAGLRILATLLYGVGAADPLTLIAVSLVLGLVCLLASYVPARRATKVDPVVALRYE
jgi:putative ABC transport system permease protein